MPEREVCGQVNTREWTSMRDVLPLRSEALIGARQLCFSFLCERFLVAVGSQSPVWHIR